MLVLFLKKFKMNSNKFNENLKFNIWDVLIFFFLWNKQPFLLWLCDANNGNGE